MRPLLAAAFALAIAALAHGDVLVLKDGRKVAGQVQLKDMTFFVKVEGEELTFARDEVVLWAKRPQDLLGGAAQLVEEAKALYLEALGSTDAKAAEGKLREALPRVSRARQAYAEARELFPDGYPELDAALVNIMKLMRLVRERIGSEIASGGAPVAPKPPPGPTVAPAAPPQAGALAGAVEVAASEDRRGDPAQRETARARLGDWTAAAPAVRALSAALSAFLARDDKDWRIVADRLYVKAPRLEQTWAGRLVKNADGTMVLRTGTHDVRLRQGPDGLLVTPPGGTEFKPWEARLEENVRSDAGIALDEYFTKHGIAGAPAFEPAQHLKEAQFLVGHAKAARAKDASAPVDALLLFAAAHLDTLLAAAPPDGRIHEVVRDAGWAPAEYGRVVGPAQGIAMASYHRWVAVGLYDMAIVEFAQPHPASNDTTVRAAQGMLYLMRALAVKRQYDRAFWHYARAANDVSGKAREHFRAMAASIRLASPCRACDGTHEVRCRTCRGAGRADFQCGVCGGAGAVNRGMGGVVACQPCSGKGTLKDHPCPKCRETGKLTCGARGCSKPVPPPTMASFLEASACLDCRGRGLLFENVAISCADCGGLGIHVKPAADPSKTLR